MSLPDATAPGDVVCLEGVRAAVGLDSYARVVCRARGGLRVTWHGAEYVALGTATGRDAAGRAVWRVTRFEPWRVPTARETPRVSSANEAPATNAPPGAGEVA